MTHDEVMAWIDEHLENLAIILADPRPEELSIWDYFNASLLANRDTLERHKPAKTFRSETRFCCGFCSNRRHASYESFPCPTYTDITKRLDEVM